MKKQIKTYLEFGDNCGIAKQIEGQVVDAEQDNKGLWHFTYRGENWVASDYAFIN